MLTCKHLCFIYYVQMQFVFYRSPKERTGAKRILSLEPSTPTKLQNIFKIVAIQLRRILNYLNAQLPVLYELVSALD